MQEWPQALVCKDTLEILPLPVCQGQVTLPHQLARLLPHLEDASQQLGAVGQRPAVQDMPLVRLQTDMTTAWVGAGLWKSGVKWT